MGIKIRPKIKLDFVDFNGLNKSDNMFTRILEKEYQIEINDRPDLLIFQEGGHLNRLYTCKKLFWTGESILPDWRRTDYALTCHYLDDERNLRMPYYVWGAEAQPDELVKREGETDGIVARKNKFCSFMVSNGNPKRTGPRIEFYKKLNDRRPVDSGGTFMNNIGGPIPRGGRPKLEWNQPYKFHICWENKNIDGYTTEKLVEAMWARCIPIYWGNPRVGEEFNTKSFLWRNNYESDEAFIAAIMEVDKNESLYREMLAEPYFHDNKANTYYREQYLLEFFDRILSATDKPVSQQPSVFDVGRWKLAKRQHY